MLMREAAARDQENHRRDSLKNIEQQAKAGQSRAGSREHWHRWWCWYFQIHDACSPNLTSVIVSLVFLSSPQHSGDGRSQPRRPQFQNLEANKLTGTEFIAEMEKCFTFLIRYQKMFYFFKKKRDLKAVFRQLVK